MKVWLCPAAQPQLRSWGTKYGERRSMSLQWGFGGKDPGQLGALLPKVDNI